MTYKIILLTFLLIKCIHAAEAPLVKEKITPHNLQIIHEKITSEIYTQVLKRIEDPRRTALPMPQEFQKKALGIAYTVNIIACGHNPSEAENTWSLRKDYVMVSNTQLATAYLENFIVYDYADVVEQITLPNTRIDHRKPAIVFKSGVSIAISPAQLVTREIMKDLKINIEKTNPAVTKQGCCRIS
jgi:hypothetical protein